MENRDAGDYLFHKGIVYAPDYVINAGGIIDIYYERSEYNHRDVINHIEGIGDTLSDIFKYSEAEQISTNMTADHLAEARFLAPPVKQTSAQRAARP